MTTEYECPVCETKNRNWYLNCQYPGCPDGRDQCPSHHIPCNPERGEKQHTPYWVVVLASVSATILVLNILRYFIGY